MKKIIFISCTLLLCLNLTAQVGIGNSDPDSSSIIDIQSTELGMLIPRMDTGQRDLIVDPANALMIYNTDSDEVQYNSNSTVTPIWQALDTRPASISDIGQSIKYSNTDITTDVNLSTAITAPLLGTLNWNDNGALYTVDTTTHEITINETGRYKIITNVSLITGGTADRLAPEMRIVQNGSEVGSYASTGYIRTNNNHQESSLHLTEIVEVNSGETISVNMQASANFNGNVLNDVTLREVGAANIYIEKQL